MFPPVYDNDTQVVSTANATTLSTSHTVGSSTGMCVVVFVQLQSFTGGPITGVSCTIDGDSMLELSAAAVSYQYDTGKYLQQYIFYALNVEPGSYTIAASWTNNAVSSALNIVSYAYVGGLGNSGTGQDTTGYLTATVTPGNADSALVMAGISLGADTDPFYPGLDMSELVDGDTGGGSATEDIGFTVIEYDPTDFYLRDDFTTTEGAPLTSPRTAEPGPGTSTIVDTANRMSISGGELVVATGAGSANAYMQGDRPFPRIIGLAVSAKNADSTSELGRVGWGSGTNTYLWNNSATGRRIALYDSNFADDLGSAANYDYFCVVFRNPGAWALARTTGGDWTLLFVGNIRTDDLLQPFIGTTSTSGHADYDEFRVYKLEAPWTTQNGIATEVISGSVSVGEIFVHEPLCLFQFDATTLPATGDLQVTFREVDGSNYWYVQANDLGDLELFEVVASSGTQRGISAGILAGGEIILTIVNGDRIQVYEDGVERIDYASATTFQQATKGQLLTADGVGDVSNIISWPRIISGAAEEELTYYINYPNPATSWLPTDLTTLVAWYDPSDAGNVWADTAATTPATNGGVVARLDDLSGNGYHLKQATGANQPTYRTGLINGLNVVECAQATPKYLITDAFTGISADGVFAAAICYSSDGTLDKYIWSVGTAYMRVSTLEALRLTQSVVLSSLSAIFNVSATNLVSGLRHDTGTDSVVYRNGVSVAGPIDRSFPTGTFTEVSYGGLTTGAANTGFEGYVAEMIVCRNPTDEEIARTHLYLAEKWGITLG